LTRTELLRDYELPASLADELLDHLSRAGLLNTIAVSDKKDEQGYQPAFDPDDMTVNEALNRLGSVGNTGFIPCADDRFAPIFERFKRLLERQQGAEDLPLVELDDQAAKAKK